MPEKEDAIIRTICQECGRSSPMLVHVEEGRAVRVENVLGPNGLPNESCGRASISLERLYSPYRLLYPQQRVGEKGEGGWQKISWDEANFNILTDDGPPYSPEMGSPKMRGFLVKVRKAE